VTTGRRQIRTKRIHAKHRADAQPLVDAGRAAVRIFAANERMNQMIIEHLDPAAWKAKAPGKARSIVAIFTHMHNVRCKWVRLMAPHLKVPRQLHRARCTPRQARAALAESAARCADMLAEALGGGSRSGSSGRVKQFRRDGWARPWPVGPEMLCYMLAHEAHHRGQIFMLAGQLGFALPKDVGYRIWDWERLWKECGSRGGPGRDSKSCRTPTIGQRAWQYRGDRAGPGGSPLHHRCGRDRR
jgi:uncharacterized damage-inducible protein DinB